MKYLVLAIAALTLVACGGEAAPGSAAPTAAPTAAGDQSAPAVPLLDSRPADAQAITAIKASAKPGDSVVVTGRIGGRHHPFVSGLAAMVVADHTAITACDESGDGGCAAPWDFCCEPADKIAAASITVQVCDEHGKPLPVELKGQGGMQPGSYVVVTGTLVEAAGGIAINADGIFIEPAPQS